MSFIRVFSEEAPNKLTPEYVLNPLAIYCMARQDIKQNDKSASEMSTTLGFPDDDAIPAANKNTTPPMHAPSFSQGSSPVDVPVAGPMPASSMGWPASQVFDFPTSFDDLQTYMQLPLMSNKDVFLNDVMHGTGIAYGNMEFDGNMASTYLGLSVADPTNTAASFADNAG